MFVCLFVYDPRLWVVNPFRLLMLLCGISRYFSVDHNFRTGDMVYYTPQFSSKTITLFGGKTEYIEWVESSLFEKGTNNTNGEGIYFVERIDDNRVKFAKSRSR